MNDTHRPEGTDASRAFLLWSNSGLPLADAIERVCAGKDTNYKATVMVLCQRKFTNDQRKV